MKALIQILFCTTLFAGLNYQANAQRGHSGGGGGFSSHSSGGGSSASRGGGGFTQPHASFHESAPRAYSNPGRNNAVASERFQPSQRFNSNAPVQQRNAVVRNNNYTFNQSRQVAGGSGAFPRPVTSSYNRTASAGQVNSRTFNNNYTVNNYHFSNNYYGGGYYNYNHRNYSFMYGPRYTYIPRNSLYISFGGYPYYYNAGFYYGYYGGFYQPLFPPFGLRIATLPFGYYSFYLGGYPYYYYNGIYYQQYDDQYEVVDAPMGATVRSLPEGVKPVVINGEKLYELNGTYYKEGVNKRGKTIYTVVGKNGQVNNTDAIDESNTDNSNNNYNNTPAPQTDNTNLQSDQVPSLQVGDMMDELPKGSRSVTISGSAMYVTPDNVYLQEQSSNGSTTYKVIGK